MSVVDTIKKSVLSNFTGTVSAGDMILSLIVAFVIGIYIIYVYRKTYTGVVYSKAFSLCILMLAMITAMIIRTISSNISLSLGMVGALSIVRFRTAVKEPVDTGFMFWFIAACIMAGAGLYIISIIASLCIGILYFVIYLMGFKLSNRYLLVLKYDADAHNEVLKKLNIRLLSATEANLTGAEAVLMDGVLTQFLFRPFFSLLNPKGNNPLLESHQRKHLLYMG